MDYYELLGISKGASDAELKSAYRKQALKWHPGQNKKPEQLRNLRKSIMHSIKRSKKKSMYDQYGKMRLRKAALEGKPQIHLPILILQAGKSFEGFDTSGFSDPLTYSNNSSAGLADQEEPAHGVMRYTNWY